MAVVGEELDRIDHHMTPAPLCVRRETEVREAIAAMRGRGVVHAPVVDARGTPVGLVSEHVLHAATVPASALVGIVMNVDPLIVRPEASVVEVVTAMLDRGTRCALVVDGAALRGIFTMSDALSAVLQVHDRAAHLSRAPTSDRWGHVISSK